MTITPNKKTVTSTDAVNNNNMSSSSSEAAVVDESAAAAQVTASANRLAAELTDFVAAEKAKLLDTISTTEASDLMIASLYRLPLCDTPDNTVELQLATCRKLREVCCVC